MRMLIRIGLALLIGIPVCLALVIFFMLQGRGDAAPPIDRGNTGSPERTPPGSERATA